MYLSFFDDFTKPLLLAITLTAVLIIIVSVPVYFLNKKSCLEKYAEYTPSFGFFTECRVEWKGKLTPVSMIKNINI